MLYDWTQFIANTKQEYPEIFLLRTLRGDELKVEVNRAQGLVRITVKEHTGQKWQSVISNGVVLREKDLVLNQNVHLDSILSRYRFDLSSLPDNQVLRLIGGNYGVLTEFLGRGKHINKINLSAVQSRKEWLRSLYSNSILKIKQKFLQLYRVFISPPQWSDIPDIILAGFFTSYAFQLNYSFLESGFFLCLAALLSGIGDYFLKKRSPYLPKVTILFLVGSFALGLGWFYE